MMKLADVFWDAANIHLWPGMCPVLSQEPHSCIAAWLARGYTEGGIASSSVVQFMAKLGCEFDKAAITLKREFPDEVERQGVRYMWLLLAMHVAEDEGIEV